VEVIYFYSAFSGVIFEIEAVSFDSLMCSSPAKRVCPTSLYAVLFTILRAEDFALLAGSLLLLFSLAATMYFTRNLHRSEPK
jgi:inner membrane protein involved in colicin E2 resistance